MNKKVRDSKYEVIRLFSMLFIILCHYSYNSDWGNSKLELLHMQFFPLGQIGVYLFVLISGYFLSNREVNLNSSVIRVSSLWIKTIIYSYLLLLLNFMFDFKEFNLKDCLISLFPVLLNSYWFITCFILLILIVPFLNWMIIKLNKKETQIYLVIFTIFIAIIPLVLTNDTPFGGPWSTSMLALVYLIAGYIKKYNINISFIKSLLLFIVGISVPYIYMIIHRYGLYTNTPLKSGLKFCYGVFPLIAATGIFLMVKGLQNFYNSLINFLAANVLSAYLITDNLLFKEYFWKKYSSLIPSSNYLMFTIVGIVGISIIIIGCSCLDKLIDKIVGILNKKIISKFKF